MIYKLILEFLSCLLYKKIDLDYKFYSLLFVLFYLFMSQNDTAETVIR